MMLGSIHWQAISSGVYGESSLYASSLYISFFGEHQSILEAYDCALNVIRAGLCEQD